MQYRLIENSLNDQHRVLETILFNRGVIDSKKYLHLNDSHNVKDNVLCGYYNLNNIEDAINTFDYHYSDRNNIGILVDSDPDGYTSAAIMYQYIKAMDETYPVKYFVQPKNKAHGLNGLDLSMFDDIDLLIIPDAGTNDIKECNELVDNGKTVLIFDHHEQENNKVQSEAIIVNNQMSDEYKNKDLSGVGIVYNFLCALDNYYWQAYADSFIDLVALGNISDVMDLRSYETRYLVNCGLTSIKNKFFQELLNAQSYSTKDIISIHNIAWYITPILNALIRIGSYEDRVLLFRAFIDDYEEFDYKKRGGEIVKETIYERAARLCKNAKGRQDKARDKIFEQLLAKADLNDKVCVIEVDDEDNEVGGIVGLSAMKLSDAIQRPCIIVKRMTDDDGNEVLSGSCRNYNNSPVEDLKEVINGTNQFIFCQGHANAAGVSMYADNLESAKKALNEELKDIVYDSSYLCDFVLDIDDLTIGFIQDIDSLYWLWCTGIKEAVVAIENIQVARKDIYIQGKNRDSVAFTINDIKFVQFKLKDGDPLYDFMHEWGGEPDDIITFNIVGECSINEYQNNLTPQVMIKDVMTA